MHQGQRVSERSFFFRPGRPKRNDQSNRGTLRAKRISSPFGEKGRKTSQLPTLSFSSCHANVHSTSNSAKRHQDCFLQELVCFRTKKIFTYEHKNTGATAERKDAVARAAKRPKQQNGNEIQVFLCRKQQVQPGESRTKRPRSRCRKEGHLHALSASCVASQCTLGGCGFDKTCTRQQLVSHQV